MNDRFKFRIYSKKLQKMFFPGSGDYDSDNTTCLTFYNSEYGDPHYVFEDFDKNIELATGDDDDCIIMQSTGQSDKNGNLLYEGDIIQVNDEVGYIFWDNNKCDYKFQAKDYIGLFNGLVADNAEVIGNIYENKELV